MAISKTINLAGKTVAVRELTVQEIYDLASQGKENPVDAIVSLLTTATSVTREDLLPFAPSDLQPLIDMLMEVNTPFLGQMRAAGQDGVATGLEGMIRSILSLPFLR